MQEILMTGKDLNGLSLRIAKTFFGNFKTLGPVQMGATKPILDGSDTLILSGTGSGKTEAAVAPAIQLHIEKMLKSDPQLFSTSLQHGRWRMTSTRGSSQPSITWE